MINKVNEIKSNGYCVIENYLDKELVSSLLQKCMEIYDDTKDDICKDTPFLNTNQPTIYNLQNKDVFFTKTLLEQDVLEDILISCLNDKWYKQIPPDQPNYILRSYGARSSNKGLPLHIDSFIPYIGDEIIAMQVAFVLEDMRIENGCTTIISGSHNSGKYADNSIESNIQYIEAKAGDIVIWDSRLWHGTTSNITKGTRWAIIATFTRWWIKQHFNIPKALPQDIYDQLSPKQRAILGYASIPYDDEYQGIEIKKGYGEL